VLHVLCGVLGDLRKRGMHAFSRTLGSLHWAHTQGIATKERNKVHPLDVADWLRGRYGPGGST
jgi:hypothetical protein